MDNNEKELDVTIQDVDEQKEITPSDVAEEEKKAKQTREQDSYYAKLRRENETLKKEKESLEKRFNSAKELADSQIMEELGIDSLDNEDDMFLYQTYKKAIADGNEEPVSYANKEYRKMIREREQKSREEIKLEAERKQKVEEDTRALKEKFGVTWEDIKNDERFMILYGEEIDYGNISNLYEKYQRVFKTDSSAKKQGILPTNDIGKSTESRQQTMDDLDGLEFYKAFKKHYG